MLLQVWLLMAFVDFFQLKPQNKNVCNKTLENFKSILLELLDIHFTMPLHNSMQVLPKCEVLSSGNFSIWRFSSIPKSFKYKVVSQIWGLRWQNIYAENRAAQSDIDSLQWSDMGCGKAGIGFNKVKQSNDSPMTK